MTHDLVAVLRPLLTAEASAEAHASGTEPGDLEQAVWLRLLERLDSDGPPVDPQGWLRRAVRSEVRRTRRTTRRERLYDEPAESADSAESVESAESAEFIESAELAEPADDPDRGPEYLALAAARRRALHAAVRRLPGRCPRLLAALLSPKDLTYREIASELGISQGSLGPERSRCLGCLRRLLNAEVAAGEPRG